MSLARIAIALFAAGCEKDLLADLGDAGVDSARVIDGPTTCRAPTTDAQSAAMHTLFVNFDGVTLKPCGTADSRMNCATIVQSEAVIPPFMDGNPARDAFIGTILYAARKGLAPYSIDIVTMRPAMGDYYMMVYGGTPAQLGLPAGYAGTAPFSCTPDNRNNVSITFDRGQAPTNYDYANSVLSDLGVFAAIPGTTVTGDCLCRSCQFPTDKLCTYGANVPVTTDSNFNCGQTSVDEPAVLQAVLGCR